MSEPIRCFEGNTKPHEPFWRLRNADETGGEPEMELFGYISEYSWWEDDITPKMFKDDLYRLGNGGPITIRMNSYGGDVIAASLMRAIIQDYPGQITVQIEGMAASAATVVAIAGDQVRIRETAYFMIHDPAAVFFLASLNIEDLIRLTDTLKSVKEGIINAYQTKSGLSRERIGKMMTKETWMSAQEAVDNGFVDAIVQTAPKNIQPPENVGLVNALRNYQNVPAAIRQRLAPDVQPNQPAQPEVQEAPAVAKLRAEVKILQKEQNL
jgi:ATP-dependent Clp protease protease subunit